MTDAYSVNNLSMLGAQNYMNNPYFMAAYNSPNMNAMQNSMQGVPGLQGAPMQTGMMAQNVPSTPNTGNIAFQGSAQGTNSGGSSTAKTILGLTSAAALIFGGYKCYNKGVGPNMISKIWDGAKLYVNKFAKGLANWAGKIRLETNRVDVGKYVKAAS